MIVEPTDEGTFVVIGRSEVVVTGAKRENEGEEQEGKKARLDDGAATVAKPEQGASDDKPTSEEKPATEPASEEKRKATRKGSGDLFLAHGVRPRLAKELDVSPPHQPFPSTLPFLYTSPVSRL